MSRACFENHDRDLDLRLGVVTDWTGVSYSGREMTMLDE